MPLSFRGVVRFQSNVEEHDPEVCSKDVNKWEKEGPCKALPKFVPFGMNVSSVISLTIGNHYRLCNHNREEANFYNSFLYFDLEEPNSQSWTAFVFVGLNLV